MSARSFRLAWLAGLAMWMASSPAIAATPAKKAVLTIYAQARESAAINAFDQSLRKTLQSASADGLTYYAEFVDIQRFSGEGFVQAFRDYLSRKYQGRQLDALVLVGPAAARAVLNQEPLFPGVPLVFYTIDRSDMAVPAGAVGLIGTFGRDQERTLELALALHPNTQQVFVVVQSPAEGPPYERYVRRALAGFESRVNIRYLSNMPTADVIATLNGAPERSVVLYVQQTETPGGRSDPRDVLARIEKSVSLPIYGGLETYIGYGVVGGYLYNGEANGVVAGGVIWRLANGERPPLDGEHTVTVPIFDARQLRRWKIDESQLPAGSVVLFREPTFWARYRQYGIAALSVFLLQLFLIGMLLVQQRRRRHAERALRDGEERYRHVVEAQSDLIVRFLPDNTLTFVNDAYCRYRGKPATALLGSRIVEKVSGDARQALQAHFDSLSVPPHAGRFESEDVMPDGTLRWHEWITHAILGPDGRVIEFMATGRDITERRRAEDALRFSESRNSAILRVMPDLMFVMSRDGTYLDYHAKDPRDLFVPPEQFLGKSLSDVMPPELVALFAPAIERADATAEPVVVEYALPMPEGERFFEARIVGSQSGQVLSIVRDVTAQKQAAANLRVSEDRYALATAAGGVGVWDWNIESDRLYVDPSVLSILGLDNEGGNRRVDWRRLVHPQDHEPTRAAAYAYLEGRANAYDMELRMLHKDGSIRWFHTRGSLVRRPDGSVYRMVGTFTDVTERKRSETLLREQEAVLRASHEEIGDLAGRLILGQETERKRLARELHDDLSQKVALLSIDLDQLRQDAPDFDTRLGRISTFTNDIATEVHQLSHQLHPFKLEALGLVAAVQSVCNDVAAQSGLLVEFQHDRVPARIHPDVTLCLFRIVQEGIRNVIKHSRARRVWVYLGRSEPDLALQIADSGVGFDLAKHERSGLGLVSMRERVHFLGGQLVIHSVPGSGTRIGVRVPLEPRQLELASVEQPRQPAEEFARAEQRRLPSEEPLPLVEHLAHDHRPAESA